MAFRFLLALLVLTISAASANAEPYAAFNIIEGAELKRAVSKIAARGHRPPSYRELWDVLKVADRHPTRSDHVVGLYSRAVIPKHCTEGKAPASCPSAAMSDS
jgi:hypothetical protein